jgi:UDPglucose 6-dehydrogenase
VRTAQQYEAPVRLIETTVEVNDARKLAMAEKIRRAAGGDIAGQTVAILGLTFKPDTDDMRASVSLVVIPQLVKAGATIRAYDPVGMDNARPLLPDIAFAASAAEALRGADLAVILTEWAEFRTLDLTAVASLLNEPVMVDLRNIFSPEAAAAAGLAYHSIGRAPRRRGPRPADVRKAG